ncbi:hypothetical protein [Paenibacillus sp. SYP-B3998]|nr:hypothetical protein [Paenibacillus sp. SYP-B3998]
MNTDKDISISRHPSAASSSNILKLLRMDNERSSSRKSRSVNS